MILELIFRNHFLSSILAKQKFTTKVFEQTFRQLLLKVWCLLHKQNFVILDEILQSFIDR